MPPAPVGLLVTSELWGQAAFHIYSQKSHPCCHSLSPAYNLGPRDPCRDDSGVCELRVGSSISLVQDDEAT